MVVVVGPRAKTRQAEGPAGLADEDDCAFFRIVDTPATMNYRHGPVYLGSPLVSRSIPID
jgi:hypothetical protein